MMRAGASRYAGQDVNELENFVSLAKVFATLGANVVTAINDRGPINVPLIWNQIGP